MEELYAEYNRREYVSPDPLEFLYRYDSAADREVVGLIASSLAYGRVASILSSVAKVLALLGAHPADTLASMPGDVLASKLVGFRHRFCGADELAAFLAGIGAALVQFGSLEKLFRSFGCEGTAERMDRFSRALLSRTGLAASHLLPCASKGSACKRLALYLRWMVRTDDVDPGGWLCVRPEEILLPLDTHMFRIARSLGLTTRNAADMRAAVQATEAFRKLNPLDPVKYDFALTRFGIRSGLSVDDLLARFRYPEK